MKNLTQNHFFNSNDCHFVRLLKSLNRTIIFLLIFPRPVSVEDDLVHSFFNKYLATTNTAIFMFFRATGECDMFLSNL